MPDLHILGGVYMNMEYYEWDKFGYHANDSR